MKRGDISILVLLENVSIIYYRHCGLDPQSLVETVDTVNNSNRVLNPVRVATQEQW